MISTIRILILTTCYLLLATQPIRAQAPNNTAQFSCANVSEIPQSECEALVELYNGTDGPNWVRQDGWLITTMPCSWHGVDCRDGSVTYLDLDNDNNGNGLFGALPTAIEHLTNLRVIDLSHNQLSSVPPEIGNLSNLLTLALSSNQLSSVPPEIGNLPILTELDLDRNQLSRVPVEIGNLSNLRKLSLWSNQLNSIPAEIGNLSSLKMLHLSSNQLSSVPPEIGNLSNLTWLGLQYNQLSSVPAEIGNLSNLRTLSLWNNQLSSVPAEISNLTNLRTLTLLYNRITVTDPALLFFLNRKDGDWQTTQTVAPTNLLATVLSDSSIQLSWEPVAFIERGGFYEISMATVGSFAVHGETLDKSANSYVISELVPGSTYFFRIRTYTSAHGNDIEWSRGDQQNELWSEYSVTVSVEIGQGSPDTPTQTPSNEPDDSCIPMQYIVPNDVARDRIFQD